MDGETSEKTGPKKVTRKRRAVKAKNGAATRRRRRDPNARVAKQLGRVQRLAARLTEAKGRLIELIG